MMVGSVIVRVLDRDDLTFRQRSHSPCGSTHSGRRELQASFENTRIRTAEIVLGVLHHN